MKKISILLSTVLVLASASCTKQKNNTTTAEAKQDVQLVTMSETYSMDVESVFESGLGYASGSMMTMAGALGPCADVTLTTDAGVRTLTIDYGTEGCMCADGKFRKGKVIATATHFDSLNVERTLVTEGYYVNGNSVVANITRTITKIPADAVRHVVVSENLVITPEGSSTSYTRIANLTRVHNLGVLGDPMDNTISTFGTVNVTRLSGMSITRTVSELTPLFFKRSCHETVSGIATVVRGDNTFTVDFGAGECDGVATVSNGTSSWTVEL